jgi:hypothetical protein
MDFTIHKIFDPFPYLIVENMYSKLELQYIWQELDFLTYSSKLEPPENTGTAYSDENIPKKKNVGLFLDPIYPKREISNILTINQKIFNEQILNSFSNLSFGYKNILKTNYDETLLSYYENGGYYKEHYDLALYSAITWFFKEPKKFFGGDFYFNEYEIKIEIKNNMTVIFPSFVLHSVDKVTMKESSSNNFSGFGRYSMSQFLYINSVSNYATNQ